MAAHNVAGALGERRVAQRLRTVAPVTTEEVPADLQFCGVDVEVKTATPFFFKQWGEWDEVHTLSQDIVERYSKDAHSRPDGTLMFKVGRKRTGRLLDGVEWNQMPE